MDDLTIFVNTHSSAVDCWVMFFRQLRRHFPNCPRIVTAHDGKYSRNAVHPIYGFPSGDSPVIDYSAATKFSNQYLMGLCAVDTPYVLTLQEDFILYADVDEPAIAKAIAFIGDGNCNAVRLIDSGRALDYSMQATVWSTRALRRLYASLDAATPWDAEAQGNAVMRQEGLLCALRLDDKLPMRGRDHRDSKVFPYIATAIVKGKWNADYRVELEPLHKEYGIDAAQRGWTE